MAIQAIQVYVLGASEDEFYMIDHLLAHCGVYRYTVWAIHDAKSAIRTMQHDDADCYILGSQALSEWFGKDADRLAASLPVVALGKTSAPNVVAVDPETMSLGQLLLAMRAAMRFNGEYGSVSADPTANMAFAS